MPEDILIPPSRDAPPDGGGGDAPPFLTSSTMAILFCRLAICLLFPGIAYMDSTAE
jgi:hypothetical protein